jgi:hypothetical protein
MNLLQQIEQSSNLNCKKIRLEAALEAPSGRIFCALFFEKTVLQQPLFGSSCLIGTIKSDLEITREKRGNAFRIPSILTQTDANLSRKSVDFN